MLIAVGMYLPFSTTFAIFIGGIIKYAMDKGAEKVADKKADVAKIKGKDRESFVKKIMEKAENHGLLLASGLVAGEALTGILLAGLVALKVNLNELLGNTPMLADGPLGVILYFVVIGALAYLMIRIPVQFVTRSND